MLTVFKIKENSRIPKYQQIVESVIMGVSNGQLEINQKIPSINEISEEFYLSRDTVEKAYRILKEKKIITSVKGKGFYIARTVLLAKKNVLFLINKPSSYKMRIYNSFVDRLGVDAHVDLSIYHCDVQIFLNLLEKYKNYYDYYVIMPHFKTDNLNHLSINDDIQRAIESIPSEKLIVLDNNIIKDSIRAVYQDFENDLYDALVKSINELRRYKNLILIYPTKVIYPYPRRILNGFRKFCIHHKFEFEILEEIYSEMELKPLDAYIVIEENDLVNLIKQVRDQGFIMGKSIGVLSYNDTPLKELLGISVVSTDFKKMGEMAAEMIKSKLTGSHRNPFYLIHRNSI
ncbi:GntR family transcriptional regulator [Flavivirga sp. 57AJ16]|uniref:GntR family transcriptional regulator n=1 Tax=Flavivirga sp. 57AJ16 TaxID=3025307 RepID=UPI002365DA0C|nr:GntR family transcriptional regulator [Flavivirga sp. 57AJ16]MDD7885144.1 GntR family transcriptional regulator [Flavivirga sp. 57AJ16]